MERRDDGYGKFKVEDEKNTKKRQNAGCGYNRTGSQDCSGKRRGDVCGIGAQSGICRVGRDGNIAHNSYDEMGNTEAFGRAYYHVFHGGSPVLDNIYAG